MTGTAAFAFTPAQRACLRKYLDEGGTLIVDAAGGNSAFARAAEELFAKLLPGALPRRLPPDHEVYTRSGPPIRTFAYRKAVSLPAEQRGKPRILAFMLRNRPAIFFSREDLTAGLVGYPCWGLKGYEPETAFRIMRNLLLYASR